MVTDKISLSEETQYNTKARITKYYIDKYPEKVKEYIENNPKLMFLINMKQKEKELLNFHKQNANDNNLSHFICRAFDLL